MFKIPLEENQAEVTRRGKLISKLFETFSKFTRRINGSSQFLKDLKLSKKDLSNSEFDLRKSKSHENLNFMRYIDNLVSKRCDHAADMNRDAEKWEVLSQIHHTPQKDCTLQRSSKTQDNRSMFRHRSVNDLTTYFNSFSSSRRTEKLNSVLNFVVSQFLGKSSNDILSKSIEDLIIECCVQIILRSWYKILEESLQRATVKNSNYLQAVCSTENSSSDPEDKQPNRNDKRTAKKCFHSYNKENDRYSASTSLSHIPNVEIEKRKRIRSKERSNASPNLYGNSTFKYKSRSLKSSSKSSRNIGKRVNIEKNNNREYAHYIVAKKASALPPNVLKQNHKPPTVENSSSVPSPSIYVASVSQHSPIVNVSNIKTKTTMQSAYVYRKLSNKKPTKDKEVTDKVASKVTSKLQFVNTASVNCDAALCVSSTNSNIKVLNIKFDGYKVEEKKSRALLKIAPVTYLFAGDNNNKIKLKDVCHATDQLKTRFSNLKIGRENSTKIYKPMSHISESVSVKSTTTFGRESGYSNTDTKSPQIDQLRYGCRDVKNSNNNSRLNYDWSEQLSLNVTASAMVNNSNDKPDIDVSETQNTDSSYTFPAVKAKYLKQYCSINYDSENDNLTSSTNELSPFINIDPTPKDDDDVEESERSNHSYTVPLVTNSLAYVGENVSSDDDTDPVDSKCELNGCFEDSTLKLASQETEKKTPSGTRQWDITSTSVVDVSPTNTFNVQHTINLQPSSAMPQSNDQSFTMSYCKGKGEKKLKHIQKRISDNLLKHTFASQQKIRLKYE